VCHRWVSIEQPQRRQKTVFKEGGDGMAFRLSGRLLLCAAAVAFAGANEANAAVIGPNYVFGTITAVTLTDTGMLIMIDGGQVSLNCSISGWMFIDKSYQTITSGVLTKWVTNNRYAYVYTSPASPGSFCPINQIQIP